jgi:imidazole glycerol-phosphate synthase subunit HisH
MIGIIDYGMGNLRSVLNSIEFLGFKAVVVEDPALLEKCDKCILPGVGAYTKAMENLEKMGYIPAIRNYAEDLQRPFLGICLGMQLLSKTGHEPFLHDGLNLISGEVVALPVEEHIPLPHVGWNSIRLVKEHPLFEGVRKDVDFYFVHSFCFKAANAEEVIGITEYEVQFASVVARDNVVGLQFHPEKSQTTGLRILENFCRWDGRC